MLTTPTEWPPSYERQAFRRKLSCVRSCVFQDKIYVATGGWGQAGNDIVFSELKHKAEKDDEDATMGLGFPNLEYPLALGFDGGKKTTADAKDSISDRISEDEDMMREISTTTTRRGDVTQIEMMNSRTHNCVMLSTWSSGSVVMHSFGGKTLQCVRDWTGLHQGSVTSIDVQGAYNHFVTSGEDGQICLTDLNRPDYVTKIGCGARAYISKVKFTSTHSSTLAMAGSGARLRFVDIRSKDVEALPEDAIDPHSNLLTCLCVHPARANIVATGSACGVVSLWDVRKQSAPTASATPTTNVPTTSICAHEQSVTDLSFLHTSTTSMVSCGNDGRLWHWDFSGGQLEEEQVRFSHEQDEYLVPTKLHTHVLPINGLDVRPIEGFRAGQCVFACTDAEDILKFHCLH